MRVNVGLSLYALLLAAMMGGCGGAQVDKGSTQAPQKTGQIMRPARAAAGHFLNPVLTGTHPDPSICRVGSDYYLATSSFEYFPGLPIHHSRDLVHWQLIGHALTRPNQLKLDGIRSSQGIYAPTLRHHEGTFYLISSLMGGGGVFYVAASDPAGPWSDPIWIHENSFAMDPSLFFDDDGRVYYTRHGGGQHGGIYQAELDIQSGKLLTDPQLIWQGTGGVWPEAPHLYKRGRVYYLLIAEGGTGYGHSVTVARADTPWGSFDSAPGNPILSHSGLAKHPIQATGHADLVETESGNWWAVLLAMRPSARGNSPLGRETFLAPVSWDDGWPSIHDGRALELEMSAAGLPSPLAWTEPPIRQDFNSSALRMDWLYLRNYEPRRYSLTDRVGFLRLMGGTESMDDLASPTLVLRPQTAQSIDVSTLLDASLLPGQQAGLVVRGNEENYYQVLVEDSVAGGGARRTVSLVAKRYGHKQVVRRLKLNAGRIILGLRSTAEGYRFYAQLEGGREELLGEGNADVFSFEQNQLYTGAYIGLYAHQKAGVTSTRADFDWFQYIVQAY